MRSHWFLSALLSIWALSALQASACTELLDTRTPNQIRDESNPVSIDRQCRMINGGVGDWTRLDAAMNIGNGRVQQRINGSNSVLLLADCNTREATVLTGPQTETVINAPCAPYYEVSALIGEGAKISMTSGENLRQLATSVVEAGGSATNPNEYFFTFKINGVGESYEVGREDRFDLLCGCNVFYPNSAGASQ